MFFPEGIRTQTGQLQEFKKGIPVKEHLDFYLAKPGEEPLLRRRFFYDDEGKLHGEQKTFYENKQVEMLVHYDHGNLEGMKALFNEKGICFEESNYKNNKLEGRFFQKTHGLL